MNSLVISKSYPTSQKLNISKNISKVFWLFIIGSFAGFFIETMWCLIRKGSIECRSSLILGPFTLIYGLGAVALYCGSYIIHKNNKLHMFLFGAVAGTVVEYLGSLAQETFFGSVSWDYSRVPLNIGGRVCLLYSVFWGLLAILWFKLIHPLFIKLITRIPARIYKPLTLGLAVFLVFDIVVSVAAVTRWGLRIEGIPSINGVTLVLDTLFPNEFMIKIYPNMLW